MSDNASSVADAANELRLRAMTWNVWWRFGRWERRQLGIHQVVAATAPDLLFLQESWGEENGPHQARQLAEELGDFHVGPEPARYWKGMSFSNVIVSRWPLRDPLVRRLPDATGERSHRTLASVIVEHPAGEFAALSSHIAHKRTQEEDRVAQTAAILAEVESHYAEGRPVVMGADLNAGPDAPSVAGLRRPQNSINDGRLVDAWHADLGDGLTWADTNEHAVSSQWPNRRIDYVLAGTRPESDGVFAIDGAGLTGTSPVGGQLPSDHYAVWADLTLRFS